MPVRPSPSGFAVASWSARLPGLILGLAVWGALDGGFTPRGVAAPQPADPPTEGLRLFREQIRPLLAHRCLNCHGGAKK